MQWKKNRWDFWSPTRRVFCALYISWGLGWSSGVSALSPADALSRIEGQLSKLAASAMSDPEKDAEEARLLYWKAKYTIQKDGKSEAVVEILTRALELAETAKSVEPTNPKALRSWIAAKGELAANKSPLVALSYLKPIKQIADQLVQDHPDFESRAGDRILGHLYRVVPSVISFGDPEKAKFHVERAIAKAPNHPENKLVYAEWLLAEKQTEAARKLARQVLEYPKWGEFPIQELDWKTRAERILNAPGDST